MLPSVPAPDCIPILVNSRHVSTGANAEPIPGYRLIERIGRGGYGEVWKAEAPGGMHKAIKFVYGDMDNAGDDGKAAEQEFKSLNRVKTIRHPFVLSLERIEIIDGQLVIVMELADRNLFDRFAECVESGLPGIPRAELLRYMEEAAEALDLMNLHHQIQHLDIKPQNIFLVHRHVKVADFGLAKDLDGTRGELTGGITPMYAAPETFDQWVSRQSDQYSLAIVYAEMLTGRRPFNGTSPRHLILQHLTSPPDLSLLASPDHEAVAQALSKKPEDRFLTCMDFVLALKGELPAPLVDVRGEQSSEPKVREPRVEPTANGHVESPIRTRPKSLPALVTPGSRVWSQAQTGSTRKPGSLATPLNRNDKPVERTGDGSLFPALVVGLGGTGAAVLRKLAQLIADRFGRPRLPHLQFLYVDTDPAAVQAAQASGRGAALTADEVFLAQLQRPAHYLAREGLPSVERWLSPTDLYRIPRTPATESIRGLGRLALCDHYHAVRERIRSALTSFLSPAATESADRLTGLGIRSTFPRVYIVSSLVGGTGSGMLVDFAYLVRRELRQLGFGKPRVVGLLGVPGKGFAQSDRTVLANARAALVELQHFGGPSAPFVAQFDTREHAVEDPEPAFQRCTLIPACDPSELVLEVSTMGHVAFAEILSPLGGLVQTDSTPPDKSLSVVGIQRIAWPRSQVLRAAAWLLSRRTLSHWINKEAGWAVAVVPDAISNQWTERRLEWSALATTIQELLSKALGSPPQERIQKALAPLNDVSIPDRLSPDRVREALNQLRHSLASLVRTIENLETKLETPWRVRSKS